MREKILGLFQEMVTREEEIKELRDENKLAIESFCEENDSFEPKAIKETYKFFKNLAKDKSATTDLEFQRDKIVEILIGSDNNE